MLILEYKAKTNQAQRAAIEEAIRTVQFIRVPRTAPVDGWSGRRVG